MFRLALFLTVGLSISCVVGAGGEAQNPGPTSRYYVTAGDQGLSFVILGNTLTTFEQLYWWDSGEYAIAVTDTIRTLGSGNVALGRIPPHNGAEYTIADSYVAVGNLTGTEFPYPLTTAGFFDGATDGRYNYAVAFYWGGVYRFNADWTNPVLLFATPAGYMGITCDPASKTLWLSDFWNHNVEHRSMNGTLLSFFPAAMNPCALALDPADGTLWLGAFEPQGRFFQYTQTGNSLGEIYFPDLVEQNVIGGEFAIAPVPASTGMVNGAGTFNAVPGGPAGSGPQASFNLSLQLGSTSRKKKKPKSSFTYLNPSAGLSFTTKRISGIVIAGRHAQFTGTVKAGKKRPPISFTVEIADLSNGDGSLDQLTIRTSDGHFASGLLSGGNIAIAGNP